MRFPVGLTGVVLAMLVACDPDVTVVPTDAGQEHAPPTDAGEELTSDAGASDAGELDAGTVSSSDAGPAEVDAGIPTSPPPPPEPPDELAAGAPPDVEGGHVCEGDEDVCEPVGDIGYGGLDVLATWSRIENDEFIVQLLFRGTTLRGHNHGSFALLIDEAGRDGPLDVRACANDDQPPCPQWELGVGVSEWDVYETSGVIGLVWPPRDILIDHAVIPNQGIYDMEYVPGKIAYALDGRLAEVHLPLSLVSANGEAPLYTVMVNYSFDLELGDEGEMAAVSVGGRMDGVVAAVPNAFFYEADPAP